MKAFVTGGTGFVGSHLVEELQRRGYTEIRCLVRAEPRWLEGLAVEFVRGDLFDAEALREGVRGVDRVFHVAGLTRAPDEAALRRANVEGTLNLVAAVREAAPEVERVLVTSSLAAVGPSPEEGGRPRPLTESDPLRPISRYGRSKAEMERRLGAEAGALPLTIVRPPVVYGPREADIYTLIATAARRRLFPIVGEGRQPQLSLVHVRDLVRGMAEAAEAPEAAGQAYFLSSEVGYSWEEVRCAVVEALGRGVLRLNLPRALVTPVGVAAELAGRVLGAYPPLNREKTREAKHTWLCSVEKAQREIGYRPAVGLEEGMAETVAWYRDEGWL